MNAALASPFERQREQGIDVAESSTIGTAGFFLAILSAWVTKRKDMLKTVNIFQVSESMAVIVMPVGCGC